VAASREEVSHGIMTREVATRLISNIFCVLAAGDHITFAFQGGEPGLAGLDFYLYFVEEVKKAAPAGVHVHYTIQTNGLMIDNNWCEFFNENNFLVGLSLDGYAALHNLNRADAQGKGTFNRVMAAKQVLELNDVNYNILCVLTAETSRRANKLWEFILRENIRYIQFIPCLEPFNAQPSKAALTGGRFYQFYLTLFPLWQKEAVKGNIISIRLFDDLAALFLAGKRGACGLTGKCTSQIVVEADGSVYPCDFFVLDEFRVGNLAEQNLQEIYEATASCDFINEVRQMPSLCASCPHTAWCRGGCKRMGSAVYGENCGMRPFLDECLNDLLVTARGLY